MHARLLGICFTRVDPQLRRWSERSLVLKEEIREYHEAPGGGLQAVCLQVSACAVAGGTAVRHSALYSTGSVEAHRAVQEAARAENKSQLAQPRLGFAKSRGSGLENQWR